MHVAMCRSSETAAGSDDPFRQFCGDVRLHDLQGDPASAGPDADSVGETGMRGRGRNPRARRRGATEKRDVYSSGRRAIAAGSGPASSQPPAVANEREAGYDNDQLATETWVRG